MRKVKRKMKKERGKETTTYQRQFSPWKSKSGPEFQRKRNYRATICSKHLDWRRWTHEEATWWVCKYYASNAKVCMFLQVNGLMIAIAVKLYTDSRINDGAVKDLVNVYKISNQNQKIVNRGIYIAVKRDKRKYFSSQKSWQTNSSTKDCCYVIRN